MSATTNPSVAPNSVPGAGQSVMEKNHELRWYAAYARPHHEKMIARHCEARSVQHFLPLYSVRRRWKDRRVTLERPLFPSYVFVRVAAGDRRHVLTVPGVVNLVGFEGRPCPLRDEEIQAIRDWVDGGLKVEPHPFLAIGQKVRIRKGAFADMQGILVCKQNRYRLVISIELLQRSVSVEVDAADVVPLSR